MSSKYVIAPGSTILVTAANCYIGTHIVDILLELGFRVRGTVRESKPWLNKYFDDKYGKGKFESVVVKEMENAGSFDNASDGVSGIIHVASIVSFSDDPSTVIPATVQGVENALEAGLKHDSVKRVVLTSSSVAATLPRTDVEYTVTELAADTKPATWNEFVTNAAWDKDTPRSRLPYYVYAAAKTESEQKAWRWMEKKKPNFTLNTVLPDVNIGKILMPEVKPTTMGMIRRILTHGNPGLGYIPQYYVNIRDTARLHVVALLDSKVCSERIFAWAREHNLTDVVNVLRRLRPNNNKIEDAPENEARDRANVLPIARAEGLLKSFFDVSGWVDFETSIAEGIEDLA